MGVRAAVLLSIAPGLAAAAAIVYAARHTPRPTARERTPIRLRLRPVLSGRVGRLLAGVGVFEVGNAAATLLILRPQLLTPARGATSAAAVALVLYAGHNLAATLVSVPAGRAADRRLPNRRVHLLAACMIAAAAVLTVTRWPWAPIIGSWRSG